MAQGLANDEPQTEHNPLTAIRGSLDRQIDAVLAHDARIQARARPPLPFRSVNRKDTAGYDPGLHRHHILPLQLLLCSCFGRLFEALGIKRTGIHDFRRNGLLLPANDRTAMIMGLPLHRGPHRQYNQMAIERVGEIEAEWAREKAIDSEQAAGRALRGLALLQDSLRRRLLDPKGCIPPLNRKDPTCMLPDIAEIDAMVDRVWENHKAIARGSDSHPEIRSSQTITA